MPTPITIQEKKLRGDTKNRGANKHAEMLANAYEAPLGRPEMPDFLRDPKGKPDTRSGAIKLAAEYWERTADALEKSDLLAEIDEGLLTSCAVAYGQMVVAGKNPKFKAGIFANLVEKYMRAADRLGLNPVARARLPKKSSDKKDAAQNAMGAFLKSRGA